MAESTGPDAARADFDLALLSDPGTDRPDNEDACGHFIDGPETALFVVGDGIGAVAMVTESAAASASICSFAVWKRSFAEGAVAFMNHASNAAGR